MWPNKIFLSLNKMSDNQAKRSRGRPRKEGSSGKLSKESSNTSPEETKKRSLVWCLWREKENQKFVCLVCEACKEISSQELQTEGSTSNLIAHYDTKVGSRCKEIYSLLCEDHQLHKGKFTLLYINSFSLSFILLWLQINSGEQDYDVEKTALKLLNELRDANKKVQLQGNVKRLMSKAPEIRDMQVIDHAICRSVFSCLFILYLLSYMCFCQMALEMWAIKYGVSENSFDNPLFHNFVRLVHALPPSDDPVKGLQSRKTRTAGCPLQCLSTQDRRIPAQSERSF